MTEALFALALPVAVAGIPGVWTWWARVFRDTLTTTANHPCCRCDGWMCHGAYREDWCQYTSGASPVEPVTFEYKWCRYE